MNVNNLVINRPLRFMMLDKKDSHMMINLIDIKEPSLEISGETVYATDSVGQKIAGFDRSKEATFTCQSSLFDLNLFAAQSGSEKKVASSSNKVVAPVVEILEATNPEGLKLTLSKTPVEGSLKEISLLNDDGSIQKSYTLNASATATQFMLSGTTVTLPTPADEVTVGTRWFCVYETEYQADAVAIEGKADASGKVGKGILEVLFCDPCNQNVEYYGYLIFPNAKLKNDINLDFNTESGQAFTIEALQDWCAKENKLYDMVVVGK